MKGTEFNAGGYADPPRQAPDEVLQFQPERYRVADDGIGDAVVTMSDITERYRQEQAVRDALDYANDIIASLREPLVVLDKDLRVKTANQAFYRTFHVGKEETEGRFVYDLGHGQWDIPRLRTALAKLLANGQPVHDFDVEHDFPAIGRKIVLLNARRLASADSRPELILLSIEDITERRRADVAVKTSEVRYRRLFQSARDGILILDAATGKIIDANPFIGELLGYDQSWFLGKELWEIGLFKDKEENQANFRELQAKEYIRYDHLPLKTKDGKTAEVEFVSNVYQVGQRLVAQCNVRDATERSRLEKRTNEQAKELADLHRRKDEFLAMLSHELRNPLAPIANAVNLLRLQKHEEPLQQQARAMIERQVGQLTRLIDDLLEVSRITTGRIHLQKETVDLRFVVERAVETVRPKIGQREHSLAVRLPPEPVWLFADAARLEQVVVNLLDNARKYSADRSHIWLGLEQHQDEAVLRVRDMGVGIAPELLPRIFELFTQAERSLDSSQGGLGIGLALVRQLVDLHGGKVEVLSALGQGSEFVVRLPVAASSARQPPANPTEGAPPTKALRVLVADDNNDAAQSLAMLFKASGHEVLTACDGPTALQAALDYRPNVVLLDISMPGMDGYEVAKRMRREAALQNVVLVARTGYGQESDRRRSREAGFDHHVVKPVDFTKLLQILASVAENLT